MQTIDSAHLKLKQRLKLEDPWWYLSARYFGEDRAIHDFEMADYVYFLDHVSSCDEIVRGLEELSPLADDALLVAQGMSERDFVDFKLALAHERRLSEGPPWEGSKLPRKYVDLVFPSHFVIASLTAKQFRVCLGACLIRMFQTGANKSYFDKTSKSH